MRDQEYASWDLNIVTWVCWGECVEGFWYGAGVREVRMGTKGNQGHYKSDCPELKNRKHGNQAEGTGARGMVYSLGGEETNQDLDDIEDDINA
nr:hypothetical protein [Tanacetum cinerariifolium]